MHRPLADEIRPKTLDEVVGQRHLLAPGGVLRRLIDAGTDANMVFYGPFGTGKTTVANIIAVSYTHLFSDTAGTYWEDAILKLHRLLPGDGAGGQRCALIAQIDAGGVEDVYKRQALPVPGVCRDGRTGYFALMTGNGLFFEKT